MKRLVCDTNVIVSGLLWGGPLRRVLSCVEDGKYALFTSRDLLEELGRVLNYPKLASVLAKAGVHSQDVFRWVVQNSTIVMPKPLDGVVVGDDPSDDMVLACAASASVDAVVSGDKHLLALGEYKGIPIMGAASFLENARE